MTRHITKMINLALKESKKGQRRGFYLGAVGIRERDGVVVMSRNGNALQPTPAVHAEARLARKLTPGSIVFVARLRRDGLVGNAMPCVHCRKALQQAGIDRVYYTTGDSVEVLMLT